MARKKSKTEESKDGKEGNQTHVSDVPPQEKKYSDALKAEVFGVELKDYQQVFQLRLFAPATQIKIRDVIRFFNGVKQGSSFFGLEKLGKDLIASFHSNEHRQCFADQKTIKVNKLDVKVEVYPPLAKKSVDLGNKYIMSKVPMTSTGPGVARALSPLQPTRFLFEKYDDKIRTGRVIFWSLKQEIPNSIFINGTKVHIKKHGSPQSPRSETNKVEEKQQATPKDTTAKENTAKSTDSTMFEASPLTPTRQAHGNTQPLVETGNITSTQKKRQASPLERITPPKVQKPPLEEDAPIVDSNIFKALGLPTPNNHAVLSIYEQLESEEHLKLISNQIPSPVGGKPVKSFVKASNSLSGDDMYILSVQSKEDSDDMVILQLEGSYGYEAMNNLYQKKRWVQSVAVVSTEGNAYRVLILFKSRIFKHRSQFEK